MGLRLCDGHCEREGPRAVEIGKGSTTGTFPVVTDAVGLRPGAERALTIAAFYAEPTEAQMVLVGPER